MKLQLEFEENDFHEMIEEYFNHRGFGVSNMEDLVNAFQKVFKDGLKVDATIKPAAVTAPEAPPPQEAVRTINNEVKVVKDNPVLSMSDLTDPTGERTAPSRDELLKQTNAELKHILKQSKDIEERNPNV